MRATSLLLLGTALASTFVALPIPQDPKPQDPAEASKTAAVTLLFVQSAARVTYDSASSSLTLEGVSPVVTFFTDRPARLAGHMLLSGFVKMWGQGDDSFDQDPPNAALSVLEEGKGEVHNAVVTLYSPRMNEGRLTYRVKVLEGELPATGGASSLFIDGLLQGGGRGAALGAVGGAIAGDAGKGAAIGAAMGATKSFLDRPRRRRY